MAKRLQNHFNALATNEFECRHKIGITCYHDDSANKCSQRKTGHIHPNTHIDALL